MKTKRSKNLTLYLSWLLLLLSLGGTISAQVTIGSGDEPVKGALLELKTQQAAANVINTTDDDNITSINGGLLLPRVKLVALQSFDGVVDGHSSLTSSDKNKLAGLMVYNLYVDGTGTFTKGIYVWDGLSWAHLTDSRTATPMSISTQPELFNFYETGEELLANITPLVFNVNPPMIPDGSGGFDPAIVTYQWYQVVGNNVHARIGEEIGKPGTIYTNSTAAEAAGSKTNSFTPGGVIKGTTRDANNAGMYRFYCEATGNGQTISSDIVEVAVGCGAKNNSGEWLSFMCFNLGADINMTIDAQMNNTMNSYSYDTNNGLHNYVSGEEAFWGDLYQWGRITQGHQRRNSDKAEILGLQDTHIASGSRCSTSDIHGRPLLQIDKGATDWFGKFITNLTAPHNWHPNTTQATLDGLWRTGRFVQNDPCAHFKVDGSTSEFWHEGTDESTTGSNGACTDAGTAWRTPQQEEWGAIYKGGAISGPPNIATANTWKWFQVENGASNLTSNRGYEIKPNGSTTTLFLPTIGNRRGGDGLLYYQGVHGYYWSSSVIGTDAYSMRFIKDGVTPANTSYRAYGFALRCIKSN